MHLLVADKAECAIRFGELFARITHLKTLFEDLFGFSATNGAVNSNLLISTNTERAHCVAGLGVHWLLAGELFQHLKARGIEFCYWPF
jgi:hypothetical protein